MTYTPATIAKAIVAFAVATVGAAATSAGGADLSVLSLGSWAAALGVGLTAFGSVFVVPNKPSDSGASAADQIINNIPLVISTANDALADLDRVKVAASEALAQIPVFGPLTKQILDSVNR